MKKLIFIVLFLAGLSGKAQFETFFVPETGNRFICTWNTSNYFVDYYWIAKSPEWMAFNADSIMLDSTWIRADQILLGNTGTDSISTTFGTYAYNVYHGLPYIPKSVHIQAKSEDAAEKCRISAITSTYFTIRFTNSPPTATKNAVFDWVAYK